MATLPAVAVTVDVKREKIERSWLAQFVDALFMQAAVPDKRYSYTVSVRVDGSLVAYRSVRRQGSAEQLERRIRGDLRTEDVNTVSERHQLLRTQTGRNAHN